MIRKYLAAAVACLIATTPVTASAGVDVRLWLGAPGVYYVPGHGAVLRFGVHPRRFHGHRHLRPYHGAKKYLGHVPARPYFRHGHKHNRHHSFGRGHRPGEFRRHDSRRPGYRSGYGQRHYNRDSRTRIYVY